MRLIANIDDLEEEIKQGQPVMILFGVLSDLSATTQSNRLQQIEKDFGIKYCAVDTQINPSFRAKYIINPDELTMLVYNKGVQIIRLNGLHTPLSVVRLLKREGALLKEAGNG